MNQLRRVEGTVRESNVVTDWYGRGKRIEFALDRSPIRYWTDRFPPELVSNKPGDTHLAFFAVFEGDIPRRTLAGTVKTYGLSVNDREVISVEDYLMGETYFRRLIMAPIGAVMIAIGVGVWLYRSRRGKNAGSPTKGASHGNYFFDSRHSRTLE
jgi:hypothetical protein